MAGGAEFLLLRFYSLVAAPCGSVWPVTVEVVIWGRESERATELASVVVVVGGHEEEAGDHTGEVGCDGSDLEVVGTGER